MRACAEGGGGGGNVGVCRGAARGRALLDREFLIDTLLVRIHFIIVTQRFSDVTGTHF